MIQISIINPCDKICDFYKFLEKNKSEVRTPLSDFTGVNHSVEIEGIYLENAGMGNSLSCDYKDQYKKYDDIFFSEPEDLGETIIACRVEKDINTLLEFVLNHKKNIVFLEPVPDNARKNFKRKFQDENLFFLDGHFYGYFDSLAFSLLLKDYLDTLGITGEILLLEFNSKDTLKRPREQRINNYKRIVVPKRIAREIAYSKVSFSKRIGDSFLSINLDSVYSREYSTGSKIFDLIVAIHHLNSRDKHVYELLEKFAFIDKIQKGYEPIASIRKLFRLVNEAVSDGRR